MEVWKDYQTGKYFSISTSTGRQTPSNRYGEDCRVFTAYSTGFPHAISARPSPVEKMYTVQPNNFDGYCQFPRPYEKRTSSQSPYSRKFIKASKVHIKDQNKIPQPLEFLNRTMSNHRSPRPSPRLATASLPQSIQSIEAYKQTLIKKKPKKDMKTSLELTAKFEFEKKLIKGYQIPPPKAVRRKLKGFFLKDIKTSGELFSLEQRMREVTNPKLFQKLKRFEELDRKMLEKKCRATRLLFESSPK